MDSTKVSDLQIVVAERIEMLTNSSATIGEQSTISGKGRGKQTATATKPSCGVQDSIEEFQATTSTIITATTTKRSMDKGILKRTR